MAGKAPPSLKIALLLCEQLQEHLSAELFKKLGGYPGMLHSCFNHVIAKREQRRLQLPNAVPAAVSESGEGTDALDDKSLTKPGLPKLVPSMNVKFDVYDVKKQKYPRSYEEYDGAFITGSLSGVYEKEEWILRLLEEIRRLDKDKVKTCGISFGHQAMGQALGGRVAPNPRGSELSLASVDLTPEGQRHLRTRMRAIRLLYHHNDAIVQLPKDMQVLAANQMSPYQALFKEKHFLSFEGHIDYSHQPEVLKELLEIDILNKWMPTQLCVMGARMLHRKTDYEWVTWKIISFYLGNIGERKKK